MEPRPLLEADATEIEKALLRAGRTESPRKEAAAHVLAVMQAFPPAFARPAVPRVKPAALVRWVKIVGVAVALGGAAAVTSYLVRPHENGPPAMPAIQETAPGETRTPSPASVSPEIREAFAPAHEVEPRLFVGDRNARPKRVLSSGRGHKASPRPLDGSLGAETKALDRAREALDAQRPSEVLRLLDEYQHRFLQGRLRPEAMVLRLAALVQAGRHGAADSLARQLLADEAYQTYALRIRSLLGEAKP